MKRLLMVISVLCIFTVLAACGSDDTSKKENSKENEEIKISKDEKVAEDEIVVNVNDTEVTGTQYNPVYLQTKMRMYQFGQDIEDKDAIKDQTLDELIAQELLKQDADKQGITVSDDEVQEEFDTFKEENKEQFAAYLEQFQLTESNFKEQIQLSLLLEKYIDKEVKVEKVSDDEVKETYDKLKEQNDELPKFEEAEEMIKNNLQEQKEQEALKSIIEKLKEKAKIKTLI